MKRLGVAIAVWLLSAALCLAQTPPNFDSLMVPNGGGGSGTFPPSGCATANGVIFNNATPCDAGLIYGGGGTSLKMLAVAPNLGIASSGTSNASITIGRNTNSTDIFIGRISSVDCICDSAGAPFLTFVGAALGGAATGGLSSPGALISTGTAPTGNTGTCSTGVTVAGGSRVGTWTSTAVCALAGTIILTALPTAPTGHNCFVTDRTTAGVVIEETATTATSATFTVRSLPTGTVPTVANDILQYSCLEY